MKNLKFPLIVFAVPGTFNIKYINLGSKYKYSFLKRDLSSSADEYINTLRKAVKDGKNNEVFIAPLKSDAMQTAYNEGLDFAAVYPNSNSCAYIQDIMDEQDYPEDYVCDVIENWTSEVKDKTYRQLAAKSLVLEEQHFLNDDHIDSFVN